MMQPNWFDDKYDAKLKKSSAKEALEAIAKDERILSELDAALKDFDGHPDRIGGTRVQVLRMVVADLLREEPS